MIVAQSPFGSRVASPSSLFRANHGLLLRGTLVHLRTQRVVEGSREKSSRLQSGVLSTFRMNTCKSVSKQRTLTPFRMNTCEKPGGGGPPRKILGDRTTR